MLKRFICLLLMLALLLAGCGAESAVPATEPTGKTTAATTEPAPLTEPSAEPTTVPATVPITEPAVPSTEATSVPTEPTTAPTEPTTAPTEPTVVPTEPEDPHAPMLSAPEYSEQTKTFFDDALFIGDSVSVTLQAYAETTGELGSAIFLAKTSFGVYNATHGNMQLYYQGVYYDVEDSVAATGAKKVFIMLGVNDIGWQPLEETIGYWRTMLERIQQTNPDVDIYIQSCLPIWTGGETGWLTNENVDLYNEMLRSLAEETGCFYIDVASYLKDYTGGMAKAYTSDRYVHLTNEGAEVWAKVLRAYADTMKET